MSRTGVGPEPPDLPFQHSRIARLSAAPPRAGCVHRPDDFVGRPARPQLHRSVTRRISVPGAPSLLLDPLPSGRPARWSLEMMRESGNRQERPSDELLDGSETAGRAAETVGRAAETVGLAAETVGLAAKTNKRGRNNLNDSNDSDSNTRRRLGKKRAIDRAAPITVTVVFDARDEHDYDVAYFLLAGTNDPVEFRTDHPIDTEVRMLSFVPFPGGTHARLQDIYNAVVFDYADSRIVPSDHHMEPNRLTLSSRNHLRLNGTFPVNTWALG
jgi:hypothetical protein